MILAAILLALLIEEVPHAILQRSDGKPGDTGLYLFVKLGVAPGNKDRSINLKAMAEEFPKVPAFTLHEALVDPEGRPFVPRKLKEIPNATIKPNDKDEAHQFRVEDVNLGKLRGKTLIIVFAPGALKHESTKTLPAEIQFTVDNDLFDEKKAKESQSKNFLYYEKVWITERSKLDFSVRAAKSDESGGEDVAVDVDYRLKFTKPQASLEHVDIEFNFKGTLTPAHTKQRGFHTFAKGSLAAEYLLFYEAGEDLSLFSVAVRPSEFEATQDFEIVNYTLSAGLNLWVPGTGAIAAWLQEQAGTRNSGLSAPPLVLTVDAVLVRNMEVPEGTTNTQKDAVSKNRVSGVIAYVAPVSRSIEAWAKITWAYLFNAEDTQRRLNSLRQAGIRYYTNEARTSAFELTFSKGRVAPDFVEDETFSGGWSLKF